MITILQMARLPNIKVPKYLTLELSFLIFNIVSADTVVFV